MGFISHDTIVVTGFDFDRIEKAMLLARAFIDSRFISEINDRAINGYCSFCVFPDGSKEGWSASDDAEESRVKFMEAIDSADALYVDYVAVSFGGDTKHGMVTRHSGTIEKRGRIMTYGNILYSGWTDTRTQAEYHSEKGYCPACQEMNYAYGLFTGDICPLCGDTQLVKPIETKCAKCNAPAYNPCQDDCALVKARI